MPRSLRCTAHLESIRAHPLTLCIIRCSWCTSPSLSWATSLICCGTVLFINMVSRHYLVSISITALTWTTSRSSACSIICTCTDVGSSAWAAYYGRFVICTNTSVGSASDNVIGSLSCISSRDFAIVAWTLSIISSHLICATCSYLKQWSSIL